MPFVAIAGTYHLVNRTQAGRVQGFEPDGDSIRFKPADPALLGRLKRVGKPVAPNAIGSVNLRLEGIDALELHFRPEGAGAAESFQPRPLADHARDELTGLLGLNPVPYTPPKLVRVDPPVERDAAPGYILSRALDVHGRPVSFAFAGEPPVADGAEAVLETLLLRRSLNYKLLNAGHAYPLFYEGLFWDLRAVLAAAAKRARAQGRGLWPRDRSQAGLTVDDQGDLERDGVLFPKLFRRLSEFFAAEGTGGGLAPFLPWLEAKDERVQELPTCRFTHFDNMVAVDGNAVRLARRPEELVFISAKVEAV